MKIDDGGGIVRNCRVYATKEQVLAIVAEIARLNRLDELLDELSKKPKPDLFQVVGDAEWERGITCADHPMNQPRYGSDDEAK